MTVEETRVLKADAESAIRKILSELQTATECKITYVDLDQVDARTKDSGPHFLLTNVTITLEL